MKNLFIIITILISSISVFGATKKHKMTQEEITNIVASTLYFEARGEGETGIKAVASIIWNRAHEKRWSKLGLAGVCLQKKQFECHNKGFKQANPIKVLDKKAWIYCQKIAKEMTNGTFKPITTGNHYLTVKLFNKVSSSHWAKKMIETKIIGNHIFGRC